MIRRRRLADDESARTVARVRAALAGYADAGPGAMVSVRHVLDLLDPRGMWSYDPQQRREKRLAADGDLDPVTGSRPVTAPMPRA